MSSIDYNQSQAGKRYLIPILMLIVPFLFKLPHSSVESIMLYSASATLILNGMITKCGTGFIRVMPLNVYLLLYVLTGLFLAVSPWILNFSHRIFMPHLILGTAAIIHGLKRRSEFEEHSYEE